MRITSNPSNLISSSYILALNHRKMKIVDNWWESGSESSTYWSWAVLCKKKNFSHPVPSLPLSSSLFPSLSIFSLPLLYPSFTLSHPFLLFPLSPFVFRPLVSSLFVPFPSLLCPSLLRFHLLFPSLRLRVLSCSLLPPLIFSPLSLSPGLGALKASPAGTGWSILSIMTPGENRFSSFWCWCLGGLEPSPTDRPGGDHSRIDPPVSATDGTTTREQKSAVSPISVKPPTPYPVDLVARQIFSRFVIYLYDLSIRLATLMVSG